MLESIINLVKSEVSASLMEKAGLAPLQTEKAVQTSVESVGEFVKNEASNGDLAGMINAFTEGGSSKNQIFDSLGGTMVQNLIGKLGLNPAMAAQAKDIILPAIVKIIGGKVQNSENGKEDLLSSLGIDMTDILKGQVQNKMGDLLGGFLK